MTATPFVGRAAILRSIDNQLSGGQSVLLAGPAGVGKTRLLDELLALQSSRDCHVERFVGTDAARKIRFGALASLASEKDSRDPSEQLAEIRSSLLSRAAPHALVLAVDDLHLLDNASLACVADLANRNDAVVLATVRTDDEIPRTVTALWTSDAVDRVDIGPLDDEEAAAMARAVLGGPISPTLLDEIVQRSGNNPLLVRELIRDGLSGGAIERDRRHWTLISALEPGPRLADIARSRTERLSPHETDALEMVAFGEPLPWEGLDPSEQDAVENLERVGLVRTGLDSHGIQVRFDLPVIGEAVRCNTSVQRRVGTLERLVAMFERMGCPRPEEGARAVRWCADLALTVPPHTANRAAREAIAALDFDRAYTLAKDAVEQHGWCEHLVTLAEVNRKLSRPAEADACLQRALDVAQSEADETLVIKRRAQLHAHQLGRPDIAVALAAAGAERMSDPRLIVELEQLAAEFSGMLGRFDDVLRASTRLLQHDDRRDPVLRRGVLSNLVYAQVMLGQLENIDENIEECFGFLGDSAEDADWAEVLWALRTGVFIQRGQFVLGERTVARRAANQTNARPIGLAATMHLQLLLYRSSPAIFDLITATMADLRSVDEFGALPIAASLSACALAQAGRIEEAESLLALIPDEPADVRTRPFVARGRAAVLAMRGEVETAAALVIDVGQATVASTNVVFGVTTLHDAVRFGRARDVADLMASATEDATGSFTRLLAADAVATRDEDGRALARIATAFHDCGARVLGAEAMARATHFLDPDSDEARQADAKRTILEASIEPFLIPLGRRPIDALTQRELDIAVSAANANTSREIADAHFISVRTVDNHLRQVYRKLGVEGRIGVVEALGPFLGSS